MAAVSGGDGVRHSPRKGKDQAGSLCTAGIFRPYLSTREYPSDDVRRALRAAAQAGRESQSGLELNVVDHYNGSERSVNTLSDGESFKASLSLALGMTDEIQSASGGVQIDTLFVDEGFGSLDEESLQQAFHVLSQLSVGRLVGIISHVSELKDRIERQNVVKKERSGGSHAEIIL